MSKLLNIIILAAGKGTRMYSEMPKVLHSVAGKTLLEHVIHSAEQLNPNKICVVIGHGKNQIKEYFKSRSEIQWVEQKDQLGTGHAVLQALPYLDEHSNTLILYGDVPFIQVDTLNQMVQLLDEKQLGLLTVHMTDPTGYGRIVRDNSKIEKPVLKIVEQKDASIDELAITEINTGIMIAETKFLHHVLPNLSNDNAQKEYYLTDLIEHAVQNNVQINTHNPREHWEILGINNKTQLAEAERIYQLNYAKKLMNQGVTLIDPQRIDIRGELICGQDVSIDVNCIFIGKVIIENGVTIGANCVIQESIIGKHSIIKSFTHIESAKVGEENHIGPYSRLRPNTVLQKDVHIGNFVELKNCQIDNHSKASHLSYLGDAEIGKNVNIGAGTITCNYDGANKFKTIIQDDVFIGSDTQLVAPVTIESGVTIGAGSTITRSVGKNLLALSRTPQVAVTGWTRPVKIKKK